MEKLIKPQLLDLDIKTIEPFDFMTQAFPIVVVVMFTFVLPVYQFEPPAPPASPAQVRAAMCSDHYLASQGKGRGHRLYLETVILEENLHQDYQHSTMVRLVGLSRNLFLGILTVRLEDQYQHVKTDTRHGGSY